MPIAQVKPTVPQQKNVLPVITDQPQRTNVVDTAYQPANSLLAYVSGSVWVVNYFSQIVSRYDEVKTQDPSLSPTYQQYREIINLELRVSQSISSSWNSETNTMELTGSAILGSYLLPNYGDMFVADIGDGHEGVFSVTNVDKKSALNDSVCEINYSLVYYSHVDPARRADLNTKTITSLYFVKDRLVNAQSPLLISQDYNAYHNCAKAYRNLTNQYLKLFTNAELKTLILPLDNRVIYDHHIQKAFQAITSSRDFPGARELRTMNVQADRYLDQPTVIEALLNRDLSLLETCNQRHRGASPQGWDFDPSLASIVYTWIDSVVYPMDPETSTTTLVERPPLQTDYDLVDQPYQKAKDLPDHILILNQPVPYLPTWADSYYVFSQGFYDQEEGLSLIEQLAMTYLRREPLDPVKVDQLVMNQPAWTIMQRFYYMPVVLMFLRVILGDSL